MCPSERSLSHADDDDIDGIGDRDGKNEHRRHDGVQRMVLHAVSETSSSLGDYRHEEDDGNSRRAAYTFVGKVYISLTIS